MKNIYLRLALLIITITTGCDEVQLDLRPARPGGYKEYVIEKDAHHSNDRIFDPHNKQRGIMVQVWFDSTWAYDLNDPMQQLSWNKIVGVGYGNWQHDKESFRLSGRWNLKVQKLELGCYVRHDGDYVHDERAIQVELYKWYLVEIKLDDNNFPYILVHKDMPATDEYWTETIKSSVKLKPTAGFILSPYFGGTRKAPHKMRLRIKRIGK